MAFAQTAQDNPSGKSQRAVSGYARTEHSENKGDFLLILTNSNFQRDGVHFQLIQDYGFETEHKRKILRPLLQRD